MFPKQLEGSLVGCRGETLARHPRGESLGAGLVQEGGIPLSLIEVQRARKPLPDCRNRRLTAGFWVPKTYLTIHLALIFAIKR